MRRPRLFSVLLLLALTLAGPLALPARAADDLVVTLTRVDSEAFPYVTVEFTVSDADGLAVPGLTSDSFEITEDGSPVQPTNLTLETLEDNPTSLVLVLDASVDWQAFGKLQAAAAGMVDALGPEDQMAVLAFSENVEQVQAFTPNRAELKTAIESLVATGVTTALNDAAVEAVRLARTAPTLRRAVVLVTNSGNNAGSSSAQAAIEAAVDADVPIYTVGYGSNAASAALREMSIQTRGTSYSVATVDGLRETLPGIAGGLRQITYRLNYFSSIASDNDDHVVAIGVSQGASSGQGSGSFVAFSSEIIVTIPGLTSGQTVVGKVYLVAEVDSASPVASVEYLLNGQPIASVGAPPYSFEWDSTTVNPGTYQLTARATDAVGNQGETTLMVVVALPFTVQITAQTDRVQVGDEMSLEARVDTPAQIAQVDLIVDEQVVSTDTSPPYRFTFDTGLFEAGDHTLTVRATDTLGRTAEASLPVRFTAPWWPVLIRGAIALALVLALPVVFIIGVVVARNLARAQDGKLFRACYVELSNTGNARTRFELRADDPLGGLSFEFGLNGAALAQRQMLEASPAGSVVTPVPAGPSPVPSTASATPTGSGPGGGMSSAKRAMGVGFMVGEVMSSIGYLLPGSLGSNLLSMGTRLQTGQAAVSRLERQGDLAKSVVGPRSQSTAGPVAASASPASVLAGSAVPVVRGVTRLWYQTPPVEPAQTLAVTLTMRPVKSKQTEQYFFRVISQVVDVPDMPQVIEQGKVEIKGLSLFQRLLPWLVIAGTLFVMLIVLLLLAAAVGLFG